MSRWRVMFWLDDQKADELEIGLTVLELKKKRQFVSTVKAGIRLMTSLRAGKTDVLFELFPHLEAQLVSKSTPPPDTGDLEARIAARIDSALQEAMLHAPGLPATTPVASGTIGKGKTFTLPLVDDDDDGDTIVLKKATGHTGENMMAAFAKMGLL